MLVMVMVILFVTVTPEAIIDEQKSSHWKTIEDSGTTISGGYSNSQY